MTIKSHLLKRTLKATFKILSKTFFLSSFLILGMSFLSPQDKADYRQANKLIKEKKQDIAIAQILEMLEKHPESFNVATDSLKRAMKNQDKFVTEFLQIIAQLNKNPDDNTRLLQIIANLERLNSAMEPEMRDFLQRLKVSSLYAANKIKFNNIMREGIELIKLGKYADASSKFIRGFSICYADYHNSYVGTERLEKTEEMLKTIRRTPSRLRKRDVKFVEAINAYRAMLRSSILNIDANVLSNFEKEVDSMHAIGEKTFASGLVLNEFLLEDEKKEDFTDDSFLPYSTRLAMGRSNATEYEGVQGAVDAAIFVRLLRLQEYIIVLIQRNLDSSFSKFKFGSSFDSVAVQTLQNYINEYTRVIGLIEKLNANDTKFPSSQEQERKNLVLMESLKGMLDATLSGYSKYSEIKKHKYKGKEYDSEDSINDITELYSTYSSLAPIGKALDSYSFQKLSKGRDDLFKLYVKLLASITELYQDRLYEYASVKNEDGKSLYATHESQFLEAKKLIEGATKTEAGISAISKNPTVALSQFDVLSKKVNEDISALKKTSEFISKTSKDIEENLGTRRALDGMKETERKMQGILDEMKSLSTKARGNIFNMNLAKQEADFRYNEAIRLLKNSDFSSARDNITKSQEKSKEALALEDNAEYKSLVEDRLTRLGLEINQKENEFVVREVRTSLEKAKKLYFNGNFGEAEGILVSANTRWHSTNIEENEEIQNWLGITATASVMKTGRTISQSATLYPQMSQLLSNSKQLYNEATKTIKVDRKSALNKLSEARNNIKQVLLVYPLNEEAGQLNLRIDQLIDPENFSSQVRRKIEKIRSDYRRNPQTHYAELLNLYIMDKNFPGIAKLKDEVEIYLGIKIIPPDTSAIDRSLALTNEADAIFKSGNKARYNVALQNLNQAIRLNPNNERASLLKDRIQMSMGGTAIAVLSYANEEKYRQAVLALQRGNKITAIALVEQLLQDPEGRKSAKVHNLKKRINAQL